MRPPPRSARIRGSLITAVTALALAATGCSDDSASGAGGGGSNVEPLTSSQAKDSLLSEANLGDAFIVVTDDDDDDDDDSELGCLTSLDDLDRADAPIKESVDYEATNDLGLPTLSSAVSSFPTVSAASDTFAGALEAFEGCTEVEATDDDGTTTTLDVKVDSEKSTNAAEEQFNIAATGTVTAEGLEFEFGLWASAVRIENHVAFISYADIDSEAGAIVIDTLTSAAAGRLEAVIADEEPNDDLIELDTGSDSSDDEGTDEAPDSAKGGFE